MSSQNADILIIGAGIGGLTTAVACNQKGFSTIILERASELSEIGSGIWLAPNALQVYEMLGLVDELTALGHPIYQIKLCSTYSGEVRVTDINERWEQCKYPILAIQRIRLQKFLAKQLGSERIVFGAQINNIEQDEEGITVQLADDKRITARILVGADGLNSQVRRSIFHSNGLRYSGMSSFRGIAKPSHPMQETHTSYEIWAPGCRLGTSFISTDEMYWYLTFDAKLQNHFPPEMRHQTALALVKKYFANHIELIQQTDPKQIIQTDLSDLKIIKKWTHQRVCLLGDAAHATTPNLGQGSAQAIEDSMALALSLKKYGLTPKALNVYNTVRVKKAHYVVNKSWEIGKICHLRCKPLQAVRDFAMRWTPNFIENKMFNRLYTPVIQ